MARYKMSRRVRKTRVIVPPKKPHVLSLSNAPKVEEVTGFKVGDKTFENLQQATFYSAERAFENILANFQSYDSMDVDGLIAHLKRCPLDREIVIRYLELMGPREIDVRLF